jgi:hypothetical protein
MSPGIEFPRLSAAALADDNTLPIWGDILGNLSPPSASLDAAEDGHILEDLLEAQRRGADLDHGTYAVQTQSYSWDDDTMTHPIYKGRSTMSAGIEFHRLSAAALADDNTLPTWGDILGNLSPPSSSLEAVADNSEEPQSYPWDKDDDNTAWCRLLFSSSSLDAVADNSDETQSYPWDKDDDKTASTTETDEILAAAAPIDTLPLSDRDSEEDCIWPRIICDNFGIHWSKPRCPHLDII